MAFIVFPLESTIFRFKVETIGVGVGVGVGVVPVPPGTDPAPQPDRNAAVAKTGIIRFTRLNNVVCKAAPVQKIVSHYCEKI